MALKIGAGDLNRNVLFKAPLFTVVQGTQIITYPTVSLSLWAAVRNVSQFRALEAGVDALIDSKEFIVRWAANRETITKDYIMIFDDVEHTIESLEVVDDRWLKIIAKSKTNG